MPDKIRVEAFEVDLQDLVTYRQVSEDDYTSESRSLADIVVDRASHLLMEQVKADDGFKRVKDEATRVVVTAYVEDRIKRALEEPITVATSEWGSPAKTTTLTELIDERIKNELVMRNVNIRGDGSQSVLHRVISEVVNARLETDLKAAFNTARTEMLNAAAEVGKKALQAAVGKAFS